MPFKTVSLTKVIFHEWKVLLFLFLPPSLTHRKADKANLEYLLSFKHPLSWAEEQQGWFIHNADFHLRFHSFFCPSHL